MRKCTLRDSDLAQGDWLMKSTHFWAGHWVIHHRQIVASSIPILFAHFSSEIIVSSNDIFTISVFRISFNG